VNPWLDDPRADINRRTPTGTNALEAAIFCGRLEVARLLIALPSVDVNDRDGSHGPPLYLAVSSNQPDVVEWLCGRLDLMVNRTWSASVPWTPLMEAARLGNVRTTEILLSHPDIDPRARTWKSGTALRIAKEHNCVEVAAKIEAHLRKGGGSFRRLGVFFS
jgi:ankyrin repeat protein